mmetsp:Transcript_26214/g.56754  ORF Transcript_26214/g.56754 Transcript_26214/m.56754 type:complete len:282 (-) Transcript_26214:75-920(-)
MEEELSPRHVLHHKIQLLRRLERILHANDERVRDILQSMSLRLGVLHLILRNHKFLLEGFEGENFLCIFLAHQHDFTETALAKHLEQVEIFRLDFVFVLCEDGVGILWFAASLGGGGWGLPVPDARRRHESVGFLTGRLLLFLLSHRGQLRPLYSLRFGLLLGDHQRVHVLHLRRVHFQCTTSVRLHVFDEQVDDLLGAGCPEVIVVLIHDVKNELVSAVVRRDTVKMFEWDATLALITTTLAIVATPIGANEDTSLCFVLAVDLVHSVRKQNSFVHRAVL